MRPALLLLAVLLAATSARAQLSGTYTVGGASPDYATPAAAATAVTAQGVSGPVTFAIRPGTYDGSVVVGAIAGASAVNRVRFVAETPANRPLLRHTAATAGTNWVVRLDGADHVSLENLRFEALAPTPGRIVWLDASPEGVAITGCAFTGLAGVSTADATLLDGTGAPGPVGIRIEDNTFTGGYAGVEVIVTTPAGAGPGVQILGNTLSGQYDLGIRMNADGRVEGNVVTNAPPTSGLFQGIVSTFAPTSAEIVGNTVSLEDRGSGIDGNEGTTLIANNAVSVRGPGARHALYSTGGLVAHNTVRAEGANHALMLPISDPGGPDVIVRNNILIATGTGAAIYDNNTNSLAASDGNDLVSASGTLVFWQGGSYATLAAWQAASGFDAASVSVPVTFASTGAVPDLHLAGASAGDPVLRGMALPEVPVDIDGDWRSVTLARMGADEGVSQIPLDNADTPGGFYTVAGTAPDFATPQDFFDALAARGMKGPVTVRIRAGTFPLHATLTETIRVGAAAADPAATPLIVRAANPSNRPVLTSAGTPAANWALRLDGLDAVRVERLVFSVAAAGDAGTALRLDAGTDGVDDLTVDDCTFTGAATGAAGTGRALIAADGTGHDRLTVTGSRFTDGTYAVSFPRGSAFDSPDAAFLGSTFTGASEIALSGLWSRVRVEDNTFTSSAGDAVNLGFGTGYTVLRNRISLGGAGSTGLGLFGADAAPGAPGIVANNTIRAAEPVHLSQGAVGARIVHNTLYATGATGSVLRLGTVSNTVAELTSNILFAAGGGPALTVLAGSTILDADRNLYAASGAVFADVAGTTYATLSDYRAATGLDAASRTGTPAFVDAAGGDLHLAPAMSGQAFLAGAAVPDVTTDLDGAPRAAANPYVGADELAPLPAPLAGTYHVYPGTQPADFATLQAAADALATRGVSGPVTLRLQGGPHAAQVALGGIPGASPAARVVITAAGAHGSTTLTNAATSDATNHVLHLDGTSHLTVAGLAFSTAGGAAPFGRAIRLSGRIAGLRVENSTFAGRTDTPLVDAALVHGTGATSGLVFFGNTFVGGSYGVHHAGDAAAHATGTEFRAVHTFSGQTAGGLRLQRHDGPLVQSLVVQSAAANVTGLALLDGTGGIVGQNRIALTSTAGLASIGLALTNQDGTPGAPLLVANNFVRAHALGVVATDVDGLAFVHNSVYTTLPALGAVYRQVGAGSAQTVRNNVLVGSGGHPVLSVDTPAALGATTHNAVFTPGSTFAVWGGTSYATLAAFQSATGQAASSVHQNVTFADAAAGDLHLAGASVGDLALAGVPEPSVVTDIDAEARSAVAPYRGADEASVPLDPEVQFSISVQLEGAFRPGLPMRNALATAGLLPLAQPYADPAFDGTAMDYDGAEAVEPDFFEDHPDFVDWVLVGLRVTPAGPDVARRALLLHTDTSVRFGATGTVLSFPVAPGTYHVVVYHRNHLPLMSVARALSGSFQTVDLASPAGVYGGAASGADLPETTNLGLVAGDADGNGRVRGADRTAWRTATGDAGYEGADFDLDGHVLADDRQRLWLPNQGRTSSVPEGLAPVAADE